ncbi:MULTISPECIES: SDR family NAD(P)-dependent oxidoreductase [Sphingobacterium]|jgi:NAD(P)-dependent dehydrogenase (short-subunit alcohol dehydrogenase family)|uniref:SDR family oxidoreductase n=1 Tax=Sphingobacterium kitahiroshimense TaxID=470446 RepID=A0ABV0BRR4_9SPHI|nr:MULTISPECIES: SDR family oxidoreductase [unclassified Sphingobacterium]KKX50172.1 short-chain dehydrogenase [Sphingobacterium sp. IITKGP-BTPF85]MBB2953030.1 NAD(P)-dependent dehydrogenase (short-subunit alcohol dehydrogenase family) [Sphingobacterium sp. JUb56]NJI75218.1 SDR family oxidoreductase [Sphingobacterium sp. B16(2022)]
MANIIITGASSGIGFEAVLDLTAKKENNVIALARSADKLKRLHEIAKDLNFDGGNLYPAQFDIVYDDYQTLLPFIKSKFEQVDILINNAGVLINKPFMDSSLEEIASMFQTNVLAHANMIQHIVPLMPEGSHILNIGSMGGFQGSSKFSGLAAYSSSKAALAVLTECLAEEFKGKGIRVNCLALGSAQTEMFEAAFPGIEAGKLAFEMGRYIAEFAQNGHQYYNGKILPVALTTP